MRQGRRTRLEARPQRDDVIRCARQPRAVRHQLREGHRHIGVIRRAHFPPEIVRDITVEIDLALIHEPQGGERHHQLGNRSDPHRIIGLDRARRLHVRQPLDDQRADAFPIEGNHHRGGRRGRVGFRSGRGGEQRERGEEVAGHDRLIPATAPAINRLHGPAHAQPVASPSPIGHPRQRREWTRLLEGG